MIETTIVNCPYCGESFETSVDCSAGNQSYVEDCFVCCQPIEFTVHTDGNGNLLSVDAKRGDE